MKRVSRGVSTRPSLGFESEKRDEPVEKRSSQIAYLSGPLGRSALARLRPTRSRVSQNTMSIEEEEGSSHSTHALRRSLSGAKTIPVLISIFIYFYLFIFNSFIFQFFNF